MIREERDVEFRDGRKTHFREIEFIRNGLGMTKIVRANKGPMPYRRPHIDRFGKNGRKLLRKQINGI